MWIERAITQELKKIVRTSPVLVFTGPRQVGKTALLEKIFPDFTYISLDVPQAAESAESRPLEFLKTYNPPVIIDEIQYAPSLLRYIKVWVDKNRDKKGQFILTGSQSFVLMEAVTESLAGRAVVIPFAGLSADEWFDCKLVSHNYSPEDFLWKGGFPELWSNPEESPDSLRWYQSYTATYLERDVRNLLNVGSLRDFERFLRAAAIRNGQILNMSEVGRDVGISPTTAKEWFSVLLTSGQITLLEPYYRSLGKRIAKSPKLYFTDTGLAAYLCGFSSKDDLLASPLAGAFWENHVVIQWLRWKNWYNPAATLWFWHDRSKKEVDLVIELNQKLYPIECKRKENPAKSDRDGITRFINMYGPESLGHAYIACLTKHNYDLNGIVTAINGWRVWEI